MDISIHALLAESDIISPHSAPDTGNFYPRSPCGERPMQIVVVIVYALFLSTLSLRRATTDGLFFFGRRNNFYPRSPCGERRWLWCWQLAARDISIHALLAESDDILRYLFNRRFNFYPRSPCGERPMQIVVVIVYALFLSTLSLRRATRVCKGNEFQHGNFYPRSPCGERRHENADDKSQ